MLRKISTLVFYAAAIYFIFAKMFRYIYRTHHLLSIKSLNTQHTHKWYATLIFVDPSDVCDESDRKLSWCSGVVRSFKFSRGYLFRQSMSQTIEERITWQLIKNRIYLTGIDIEIIIGMKNELQAYGKPDLDGITTTGCSIGSVEQAIKIFNNLPAIIE